eukprot:277934_1
MPAYDKNIMFWVQDTQQTKNYGTPGWYSDSSSWCVALKKALKTAKLWEMYMQTDVPYQHVISNMNVSQNGDKYRIEIVCQTADYATKLAAALKALCEKMKLTNADPNFPIWTQGRHVVRKGERVSLDPSNVPSRVTHLLET